MEKNGKGRHESLENTNETCFSCLLSHEKVEARGIWYCPNALCRGVGGTWFRKTLDSYKELSNYNYRVDENEWLEKGIIYNHEKGIDRDNFIKKEEKEYYKQQQEEWKLRELKKIIAKNAYKHIKQVIAEVEESSEICVSANWDECITVDDETFNGEELSE